MRKLTRLLARLRADRAAVTAVLVAVLLPVLIAVSGLALDTGYAQIRAGQLQAASDAGAAAGRQALNPFIPGQQPVAATAAQSYANSNFASSVTAANAATDVLQGWWDITKLNVVDKFGPCVVGQTGGLFCNAVRVTTRVDHKPVFGALLGLTTISMKTSSTGYKCSNTDYPLTLIPDDPTPPTKPTVWLSWPSDGYPANTSYYYLNSGNAQNPVIKFYSPTDGEDVSFVVQFSNGLKLQFDTYCKGTYLIVPADYDFKGQSNITGTVLAGSTNNSFDLWADQSKHPTQMAPGHDSYSPGTTNRLLLALKPDIIHTTPYPSANGIHNWASQGNPTPDRRTVLVHVAPPFL